MKHAEGTQESNCFPLPFDSCHAKKSLTTRAEIGSKLIVLVVDPLLKVALLCMDGCTYIELTDDTPVAKQSQYVRPDPHTEQLTRRAPGRFWGLASCS